MNETLQLLAEGFAVALEPWNLLWVLIGVFFGTLVGVLPGLGSPAAIALLLPLTIQLPPASALIMLAGIYYGSEYGGKTTSILMNMPGESGAIMTTIDGYPMAKKGQAGKALGIAAVASFVGGTVGLIALTFLAKPLASLAIGFGPPEFLGLVILGLSTVVLMSGKSVLKGLIAAVVGMMFALVGVDILAGQPRFIFGQSDLLDGMSFVSLIVGVFAIAEVMVNIEQRTGKPLFSVPKRLREYFPSFREIGRSGIAMGQGSIIGFLVGVVPGAGATIASFLAYTLQKKTSRNPERYGKGAIEGVAAPESANNAATSGAFIPLLTLGVPGSGTTAILLGALILFGIQPGAQLIEQRPDIVWPLIASMYVGNIALLVINMPLVPMWASILKVPYGLLYPIIIVLSVVGVYSVSNSVADLWALLFFSLIGYAFRKFDIPIAPFVLAFVLGILAERAFRQSMLISGNSIEIFLDRPIALALFVLAGVLLTSPVWASAARLLKRRGRL